MAHLVLPDHRKWNDKKPRGVVLGPLEELIRRMREAPAPAGSRRDRRGRGRDFLPR